MISLAIFVNFDAETFSFLWNVLPEDYPALELYNWRMADNPLNAVANSPIKINSNSVLSVNDSQCCSLLKNNVQALENEVKSMTVIINILRDELESVYTSSGDHKTKSTYAEKLKTNSTHHCKCTQLEAQLQATRQELSSVKLITNLLNEELQSLKQSSHVDSTGVNLRDNVKPSKPVGSKAANTAHGPSRIGHQYTVPVLNRFDALTSQMEPLTPKDTTLSDAGRSPSSLVKTA